MHRFVKVMAVGALLGATAVTGGGTASASTAAGAAAVNCPAHSGGVGSTYWTPTCTSGPGTQYAAYIECTDNGNYVGTYVRYSAALWSEADCRSGKVTYAGVLTR